MPWTQLGPAGEPAPPAGRDDGAMIEATAKAIWETRRAYDKALVQLPPWENAPGASRIRTLNEAWAAAAVIVPAEADPLRADLATARQATAAAKALHPRYVCEQGEFCGTCSLDDVPEDWPCRTVTALSAGGTDPTGDKR